MNNKILDLQRAIIKEKDKYKQSLLRKKLKNLTEGLKV